MEHVFLEHGNQLVVALTKLRDTNQQFDLQNMFQCLTFDTMCDIAFGVSPGAMTEALNGKKPDFLAAFDFAQNACSCRIVSPPQVWKLQRFLGLSMEGPLQKHLKLIDSYIEEIVAKRRAELDQGNAEEMNDLLSLYMSYGIKNNNKEVLSTK